MWHFGWFIMTHLTISNFIFIYYLSKFISQTSKPQEALAGEQMKADWVIKLEKHKESPDIASVSSLLLFDVFI